jgi:hypothetical protein
MYVEVLYGSRARGDDDWASDRDLLILSDHASVASPPKPKQTPDLSVSTYTWSEFRAMGAYGSLFLRHLKDEGRVVRGCRTGIAEYRSIIDALPRYARIQHDIQGFRAALDDVESAITHEDTTPEFELAALGTVARHSAILGCYLTGMTKFGRYSPVTSFCARRGMIGALASDFPVLYAYRMSLARGTPRPPGATYQETACWLRSVQELVEEVSHVAP